MGMVHGLLVTGGLVAAGIGLLALYTRVFFARR